MIAPPSAADVIVIAETDDGEGAPVAGRSGDDGGGPIVAADGTIEIETGDGGVIIDLNPSPWRRPDTADKWGENLALKLDEMTLGMLADDLIQGYEADEASREKWIETRRLGLELLGLEVRKPRAGDGSAPLEGMSTVRDPILLEAVIRFQANASAELLPASGPVKIRNDGPGNITADRQAETLERDFNAHLTSVASEYYPDTKQMLFMTGFGGSGFKKVYHCPLRNRPVSDSVDANDLVVNNTAVSIRTASRVTHRVSMRRSDMKRMQILGVYRDVALDPLQPTHNAVDEKTGAIAGVATNAARPEDEDFELLEMYCEIDLPGYEHVDGKGKPTGLPVPYRVTIDRATRQVLEVVRNYDEETKAFPVARETFVEYHYIKGFGFYAIGLLHILGNMAMALTGLTRIGIDAGMLANFPGFLYLEQSVGKQMQNNFRVPPGGGKGIEGNGSISIKDMIMPLPYKEFGPATMALVKELREMALRLGSVAEVQVGEGKQDAPVGTTMAMIEQATKVEAAVHKGLHASQSHEFRLLKRLFAEDPEAFWRHRPRNASAWNRETLLAALDNYDLAPQADPNTASHTARLMKAMALKQLAAASPELYDKRKVDARVASMAGIDNIEEMWIPPMPPGPPAPDAKMIAAQARLVDSQTKVQQAQINAQAKMIDAALKLKEIAAQLEDAQKQREHDMAIKHAEIVSNALIHNTPQADIIGAEEAVDRIIYTPPTPLPLQ